LVGMRSWIIIYHVERWTSEIHAMWRLVHRRFQFTSGYLRTTRITSPLSVLLRMSLSIRYIRLLCLHMVSFVHEELHMSCPAHIGGHGRVYSGFCLCVGDFLLFRFCSTFFRRQLSRRTSVQRVSTFSQEGVPGILGLCLVKPINLILPVAGGSLWEHERWHLSK
jgi:hypothetical protein